ncbi:hypothetical protein CAPTEDRAFT_115742 [Capitella teleta]|uniref:CDP-diacylglycerol--glycerol-3-phosphate 3-phosphatidyltransferase n=1 Tax=Capitella teleta TaxID=283909 RepID=R7UTI6_CAPTE|nr:hypothetical protein CAPTEDRAFT_115742 [Capitella teleta]|eukprot:ELU09495.1 hypothetical protein CAPTEDRAFT_115742 [Capitella teleta]
MAASEKATLSSVRDCSSASSLPTSVLSSHAWIGKHSPGFRIHGSQVEFLHEPADFYSNLLEQIKKAERRIVIASLYLGTGRMEQKLVDTISETLAQRSLPLKVDILLDYTRGQRGHPNSCSLLVPLLEQYGSQVSVSLYHTPDLRGMVRRFLPERYNEVVGLQHMKIYLFDDNVMLSGANLSDSYFTNRQDRYVIMHKAPGLADFFTNLVSAVQSFSFQLNSDCSLQLSKGLTVHPFEGGIFYFTHTLNQRFQSSLKSATRSKFPLNPYSFERILRAVCPTSSDAGQDTVVFPLVQMGPFDIQTDSIVTEEFFRKVPQASSIRLASGYFNLTSHYRQTLINYSAADYCILTASPQANGFYGASGVSGGVPHAYNYIAQGFLREVGDHCQQQRVQLSEYSRPGWTFHAKGLWYTAPGQLLPSATFIGSPNFGYRSVFRDVEAQAVIATDNADLQRRLHREQDHLYSRSQPVELNTLEARPIPLWVRFVTPYISNFF